MYNKFGKLNRLNRSSKNNLLITLPEDSHLPESCNLQINYWPHSVY